MFKYIDGHLVHTTRLKRIVNPVLRKIQWFTQSPFVIAPKVKHKGTNCYFTGYTIRRVKNHE